MLTRQLPRQLMTIGAYKASVVRLTKYGRREFKYFRRRVFGRRWCIWPTHIGANPTGIQRHDLNTPVGPFPRHCTHSLIQRGFGRPVSKHLAVHVAANRRVSSIGSGTQFEVAKASAPTILKSFSNLSNALLLNLLNIHKMPSSGIELEHLSVTPAVPDRCRKLIRQPGFFRVFFGGSK